jgi:NAD+ diphosphatase
MPYFYLFKNNKLILKDHGMSLPAWDSFAVFERFIVNSGFVDKEYPDGDMWAELSHDAELPEGFGLYERRSLWPSFDARSFFRIGKAFHLMEWQRSNKFCGVCGSATVFDEKELAMRCPECGELKFPVISPAVIVAVEKNGKLLMGHGINFPPGRFSVLAGFVEPGESLEECVRREVYEESKIRVKNIKYFGSQPWPFPRSLMLGFTAEWESGDIVPDTTEVTDVRWFAPYEMPDYFKGVSISSMLIEDFIKRHS